MKKGIVIVVIVLIVIVGFLIFNLQANKGASSQDAESSNLQTGNENVEETIVENAGNNIIEITSSGFSPKTLTINQGDKVTFVNKDSQEHWPATAVHPTHTVYPGSDIKKCSTAEKSNIFDACRGLAQGEEYSFTFNEKGSWNYHDHLVAGLRGTIIVN